jgi:hypothetical protein
LKLSCRDGLRLLNSHVLGWGYLPGFSGHISLLKNYRKVILA